jgi:DNA repair protein RAD7
MASADGTGFLCHPCAKESGNDPFKKPKAKPVRKRETRQIVNFEEKHFPSLVSICINIVSQHINDVEALGGLATANMTGIAKAICKNRTL